MAVMKHKILLLLILVFPLAILLKFASIYPHEVERIYSTGIYPKIYASKAFFFRHIPFSVGDVCYVLIILLGFVWFFKWVINPSKKCIPILLNVGIFITLLTITFYVSWGLNYYRIPLHERLNYNLEYTEEALESTITQLITESNTLHRNLSVHDSLPVVFPFTAKEINALIQSKYKSYPNKFPIKPGAKRSLWTMLLNYMGYAGYLNPFTLESQVNTSMPKISIITTTAHEMAHQVGYAAENEANFLAYLNTSQHPNPFIRYAGQTFALRYCLNDYYEVNPIKARIYAKEIHPGILKNFKEINNYWAGFENPLEPLLKKGYDRYLKANGQKSGIKSYNEMVGYIIEYLKKT